MDLADGLKAYQKYPDYWKFPLELRDLAKEIETSSPVYRLLFTVY